jgi:hypothetical protein
LRKKDIKKEERKRFVVYKEQKIRKELWQSFEETSGYVRPERATSGPTP